MVAAMGCIDRCQWPLIAATEVGSTVVITIPVGAADLRQSLSMRNYFGEHLRNAVYTLLCFLGIEFYH